MRLVILITALCALTMLAGCKESGSGGNLPGASSYDSGYGTSGGGDSGGSNSTLPRNPEPATLALFGVGLAGLALLRRRKK